MLFVLSGCACRGGGGPSIETEWLSWKGNDFRGEFHVALQPEGPVLHPSELLRGEVFGR